jgi:hypothetical protein
MPAPVTTTIRRLLTTLDDKAVSARRVDASFAAASIFNVVIGILGEIWAKFRGRDDGQS